MKGHEKEIRYILNNSENPIESMNEYVRVKLRINDMWWALTAALIAVMFGFFHDTNPRAPSRAELLHAARPIVDSMQTEYNIAVNKIVDSIEEAYTKKLMERH